jgi:hypothetical protein
VLVGIPSVGGDLGDEVVYPQHRFPQQFGGIDAPGQAAAHTDQRDGSYWRVAHGHPFSRSLRVLSLRRDEYISPGHELRSKSMAVLEPSRCGWVL